MLLYFSLHTLDTLYHLTDHYLSYLSFQYLRDFGSFIPDGIVYIFSFLPVDYWLFTYLLGSPHDNPDCNGLVTLRILVQYWNENSVQTMTSIFYYPSGRAKHAIYDQLVQPYSEHFVLQIQRFNRLIYAHAYT